MKARQWQRVSGPGWKEVAALEVSMPMRLKLFCGPGQLKQRLVVPVVCKEVVVKMERDWQWEHMGILNTVWGEKGRAVQSRALTIRMLFQQPVGKDTLPEVCARGGGH